MSHTFYDSPEGADLPISIDVTHDTVWFFSHCEGSDNQKGYARVRPAELPEIAARMVEYLSPAWPDDPLTPDVRVSASRLVVDKEPGQLLTKTQALQLAAKLIRAAAGLPDR